MEYKLKESVTKEMLNNTKYDVSEWTDNMKIQFQKGLFRLDIFWWGCKTGKVAHTDKSFYYVGDGHLSYGTQLETFNEYVENIKLIWNDLFEEVANENLVEECLEKVGLSKTPYKSTGGSSKYYEVVLPEWLLDKQKENGYIMIEDLAEIMFDNDFNYTNIFKAQKRMFDLQNGGGKEGNTLEYDANKCKYYVDKQLEVFNRNK